MRARLAGFSHRAVLAPELASIDFLLPFAGAGRRGMAGLAVKEKVEEEEREVIAGPSTWAYRQESPGSIWKPRPKSWTRARLYSAEDEDDRPSPSSLPNLLQRQSCHAGSTPSSTSENDRVRRPPCTKSAWSPSTKPRLLEPTTSWANSRSFVHHQLSRIDPPPPEVIYEYLRLKPELATRPALITLARYAQRSGIRWVQQRLRPFIENMDPDLVEIIWTKHHKITGRAHRWHWIHWQPRRSARTDDVHSVMCDLHYRLLYANEEYPVLLPAQALQYVRKAARAERRGLMGTEDAERDLIGLYITYCESLRGESSVTSVLDGFAKLCPDTRPDRKTLHLAVSQILAPRSLQGPSYCELHLNTLDAVRSSNHPTADSVSPVISLNSARVQSIPQQDALTNHNLAFSIPHTSHTPEQQLRLALSQDPDALDELRHILETFQSRYGKTPGAGTYRLILWFASRNKDVELSALAFYGFYNTLQATPRTISEGDTARFRNFVRKMNKWRDLMRVLMTKGWVVQNHDAERLEDQYEFVADIEDTEVARNEWLRKKAVRSGRGGKLSRTKGWGGKDELVKRQRSH